MKKSTLAISALPLFTLMMLSVSTVSAQKIGHLWTGWETNQLTDIDPSVKPVLTATPNPATGNEIKVYYDKLHGIAELTLFDISGRLTDKATVGDNHQTTGSYSFSLAQLSPGIYFIKLTNGVHHAIQKVIVR